MCAEGPWFAPGYGRGDGLKLYCYTWTWEEIFDGKGPWAQAGEYCCPKAELETVKAERRRYEDLSQLPVLTGRSAVLVRHRVMRSSARCRQYALTARWAIGQPPAGAKRE